MNALKVGLLGLVLVGLVGCGGGGKDSDSEAEARAAAVKSTRHEPTTPGVIGRTTLLVALGGENPPFLLDVRTPGEFSGGAIEGAVNIPSYSLEERIGELEAVRDREIVVYCEVGGRSSKAAATLAAHGFNVKDFHAGMKEWMTWQE